MPTSSDAVRPQALAEIASLSPRTILDIGAGAGTWRRLHPHGRWTAVEVWEPYVDRYGLRSLYDDVIVGDARTVDLGGPYDLAIAGDVLEHVPDPLALFQRLRGVADHVVVQIPVVHWPQGEVDGNPHEAHVAEVDAEGLAGWPGVFRTYFADGIGLAVATGFTTR